jgi:iron complex outermembrane receptor protein
MRNKSALSSRTLLLAFAGWAALAGAASAQSTTQTAKPADQADTVDDVVVTASPFGVSQRASTIATDVIDEQALAVAPAQSLGDMLAGQPGLRSTGFAPGASRPVIRGLSGPRVQVLTNGIGMIDASSVSPDHAVATDPAEASRIEVVRGPSTLMYGGSAIGGVVNIIDSRIPTEVPAGGLSGVISTQASSVDDGRSIFTRLTAGAGHFAFNIDGVRRTTDDYDIPSPARSARLAAEDGEPRGDGGKQPNSYTDLKAWGVGGAYIADKGYFGVSYKDTDSEYGTVAEPTVFIQLHQTREDVRGEYNFDAGPFKTIRANYGHAEYTHTEFEDADTPGTIFNSDGQEGRIDLVQRARPISGGTWNGAIGAQGLSRTFEAIGEEAFVPTTDIDEAGVYTVQRLDLGQFGFEGGLRYDRHTVKATPIGDTVELDRDFNNVSASVAGFLRPAPGLFLGLSLAHNERAPSEVELFADGLHIATAAYETGDRTLDTEKVNTLEATVHYDAAKISADLHVYGSKYDGFIDERATGATFTSNEGEEFPVFQFVQTDATFYGFEAEGSYDLWASGTRKLALEGSADYVHAETDLGPAARIPPWSVTGRLAWTSTPFDASVEVRHVAEQDRVSDLELPTDDYTLLNLAAAWRPLTDRNVTLFAEARNLTDEEAREHVSFLKDIAPMPGRNFRVGVAYRF